MKVVILEDERLAVERLQLLLQQVDPGIQVIAALETIEQAVAFFHRAQTAADVILMDIHLADGSAFEIFRKVNVRTPVIFTTAYDKYALEAFKVLSVDYLLKPITLDALAQAVEKMRLLRTQSPALTPDYALISKYRNSARDAFRSRLLGKIGQRWFFVNTSDIAMIAADNRIVHLTAMDKSKYMVDHTLDELERELEPSSFFRINRSVIVHVHAIDQVKPFVNHRLKIVLRQPLQAEEVIVSRDRVPDFKKWADS